MTPDERYNELREMTDAFSNKNMIRHHLIRSINEAVKEATLALEVEIAQLKAQLGTSSRT